MVKQYEDRDPARDEEATIVDRFIRQFQRANPVRAAGPAAQGTAARLDRPGVTTAPLPPRATVPAGTARAGTWARVGLGVLLGLALIGWPYGRACGSLLLFYLMAVATLIVTGVWGALFSWKCRLGLAHIVALVVILWGLTLTAHEILPRVGYAKTPASWGCVAAELIPPSSLTDTR